MNTLLILILMLMIAVGAISISVKIRFKCRMKKINKYSDEISNEIKKGGLDKYYEGLSTEELKKIYHDLNDIENTVDYKKDLYKFSEIGCKAKFIEDIFDARGVTIPEWK
ncbi:hypothetical protein [Clostridium saccharoperbutylacetonicum]|uniref:hypothetical protein n=1 Tax=Clostridium saccharoperbutylacetonicum TaxID=36745 RepID=UPI0009839A33|nr:hypothetical protein [Clostridium saccharoperbutylacetonicum]AQR94261.1 hypothetical protein CLSAP_15680 [Clostridium saccharoperbutylacetonicum]NSB29961.1 signal transduction histidine kinase [Clostridium saccharoperbutylacetonicum]